MVKNNKFPEEQKFLNTLQTEVKKDIVGFYDLHMIGKKYKLEPKKMDLMLKKLKGTRTHLRMLSSIEEHLLIVLNRDPRNL